MNEDHICAIISRYPQGIGGIDLRFALQLSFTEFQDRLTPLLINKRVLCTPDYDFKNGLFTMKTKEVFSEPDRAVISHSLRQMHSALQKYPNGLRPSELASKLSLEVETVEEMILGQKGDGFVGEADTSGPLGKVYCTHLNIPVERLVQGEKMLPALSTGRLLFRWGSLGVVIPYLLYVLLF